MIMINSGREWDWMDKKTKMSKRKEHIEWELSILKIGLNSRYGINKDDNFEERQQKISNRIVELKEELKALNQNKDE